MSAASSSFVALPKPRRRSRLGRGGRKKHTPEKLRRPTMTPVTLIPRKGRIRCHRTLANTRVNNAVRDSPTSLLGRTGQRGAGAGGPCLCYQRPLDSRKRSLPRGADPGGRGGAADDFGQFG